LPALLSRAHLLQLLEQLLRRSHPRRRLLCRSCRRFRGWRRSLYRLRFVVAIVNIGIGLRRRRRSWRSTPRGRAKNQFSRRAVAKVSKQNLIVGCASQQIGEHIARCPRAKIAEYPLVTAQALDLMENRGEARIIRVNRQIAVGKDDLCIPCRLLQQ
jgi:hypothetical protein